MSDLRLMPSAISAALLAASLASSGAVNADTLKWGPVPAFLPPGAQIAVLDGDPAQTVRVTLRLKMPAGYRIPAHWHPTQEDVTVLSGSLYVGMGDALSKTGATRLDPGGFMALPARMNHYVWTDQSTTVQVHLQGPFAITYVDPANDPRR